MVAILKFVVNCNILGLQESFFGMHFLKPLSMQQQMKIFIKDCNMYLSKLHNLICKNVQPNLKI
jgi:hypothetical protein